MSDHPFLPKVLAQIADAAGLEAALKIAEARGGQRVSIPARIPAGHWLAELVGRPAATQIAETFRLNSRVGEYLDIPLGPKNYYAKARRRFCELVDSGISVAEASARLGLHLRTGRRYRARMRDVERAHNRNPSQMKLF